MSDEIPVREKETDTPKPPSEGLEQIRLSDGSTVWGLPIEAETLAERWNVYELPGGWIYKLRVTPQTIYFLYDDDGEQMMTDDGKPRVSATTQAMMRVA